VADQHDDHVVRGFRTRTQRLEAADDGVARRAFALQQHDATGGRAAARHRGERVGVLRELLVVTGLAAETADDQVVKLRLRRRRCERSEGGRGDE
jgi:hypothetical protein